MLPFVKAVAQRGIPIHLYLFNTHDDSFIEQTETLTSSYAETIVEHKFSSTNELLFSDEGLLVVSHEVYNKLVEEENSLRETPSMLIIRDKIDK